MDPLLLKYYERELQYIKEMGAEFAKEYPKVAARLGIDGVETADPYVERLYEGFAFLASRLHLRLDAEFPRFTQSLLELVYPQYLSPTPAMTVVEFLVDSKASLESGAKLPRGTAIRAARKEGEQTACEFRTGHEVNLWPIKISSAEYFSNIGSVSDLYPNTIRPKAGLRVLLQTNGGQPLNETMIDELDFFLSGQTIQANRIFAQVFGKAVGFSINSKNKPRDFNQFFPVENIEAPGFLPENSLFPQDARLFSGFALLREYFAFPDRLLFIKIKELGRVIESCDQPELEVVFLFDEVDPELEGRVTEEDFKLHCAPAINLFPKRSDRVHVNASLDEQHIVLDRTRPLDFEIFNVDMVKGFGQNADDEQVFLPLYKLNDVADYQEHDAFFSVRRQRKVVSTSDKKKGPRSGYIGSESFINLVDRRDAPFNFNLRQLEVQTLCTNRDLPINMPVGRGDTDFNLDVSAPVEGIKVVKGPTRPSPSLAYAQGELSWRLVSQLSLNYLTLVDGSGDSGASGIRQLLQLYGDLSDPVFRKQVEGVRSISVDRVTRRIPIPGPIAYGRGLEVTVIFDEANYVGMGYFMLGAVLEDFFARYVSINSFTQTVIRTTEGKGEMIWPVRIGQRHQM